MSESDVRCQISEPEVNVKDKLSHSHELIGYGCRLDMLDYGFA